MSRRKKSSTQSIIVSIPEGSDDKPARELWIVECDEETANNYLAMAEMEECMEDLVDVDAIDDTPTNVMQFMASNIFENQNDEAFYNSSTRNDMKNYIGNFSRKKFKRERN